MMQISLISTLNIRRNYLFLIGFCFVACLLIGVEAAKAQQVEDLWVHVRNDRADDVQTLLARGLDPNTRTKQGNPILMQAVRDDAWTVFDVVLANPKTNIEIMNAYQETPLMYVSLVGDLPRAKKLVSLGAQINHLGWTPLHYAAAKGQLEVVEYLLAQGAMPNAPAPDGSSPILMAASAGAIDTVQALLKAGADPSAVNSDGADAVTAARDRGHDNLAEALEVVIAKRKDKRQ